MSWLIEAYLDENVEEKKVNLPKGFEDYLKERIKTAPTMKIDDLPDGSIKDKIKERLEKKKDK